MSQFEFAKSRVTFEIKEEPNELTKFDKNLIKDILKKIET
jgi:hypothetical protein